MDNTSCYFSRAFLVLIWGSWACFESSLQWFNLFGLFFEIENERGLLVYEKSKLGTRNGIWRNLSKNRSISTHRYFLLRKWFTRLQGRNFEHCHKTVVRVCIQFPAKSLLHASSLLTLFSIIVNYSCRKYTTKTRHVCTREPARELNCERQFWMVPYNRRLSFFLTFTSYLNLHINTELVPFI